MDPWVCKITLNHVLVNGEFSVQKDELKKTLSVEEKLPIMGEFAMGGDRRLLVS
jgi:hypothetical protein